jgi:hypothetical protein
MKYDRIRQFNDIRKKPVEQLARYQVGQLNMIAASDIETLREKNKFLIEDLKAGKGYRVFSETESESEVETETEGEDESENKDEDEGEIEDDQT